MRKAALLLSFTSLATTFTPQSCPAQETRARVEADAARSLHFANDIMATKSNDQRLYVVLGSGFLRPTSFGDTEAFVTKWLAAHPVALVTEISRMTTTNTISHKQQEIVYVWIEQGDESLNVDLVGAGMFLGGTMYDMVDGQKPLDAMLKSDPKLADLRAQIEKERAAAPQDRADRLIADDEYQRRMQRVEDAGRRARAEKLGIWSDTMKEEREADGVR